MSLLRSPCMYSVGTSSVGVVDLSIGFGPSSFE